MSEILILEDERINALLLRKYISKMGHSTIYAANGIEALNILEGEKPNIGLIVTDHDMPHMNGSEFLYSLRNNPILSKYHSIPAIGVGDFPYERLDIVKACFPKPWDMREISHAIKDNYVPTPPCKKHLEEIMPTATVPYGMRPSLSLG